MFSTILFVLVLSSVSWVASQETVTVVQTGERNQGSGHGQSGKTVGLDLTKAYSFNAKLAGDGVPTGYLNFAAGGKVGREQQLENQIQHQTFSNAEPLPQPQPQYYVQPAAPSSVWFNGQSGYLGYAGSFAAGVALAGASWYIFNVVGTSYKKTTDDVEEVKKDEKAKSRRRRDVKPDESLTNLTSMVLAAIESGECMQKSICLMGAQFGTGKGRLAASLLDKMLPESVHESPYFVTFRNALRTGPSYCEKMRCKH